MNINVKKFIYYLRVRLNRFLNNQIKSEKFRKIESDLEIHGISFLPKFIKNKNIDKILNEVNPHLKNLINKPNKKLKFYRHSREGIYRLYEISKSCPTTKKFYNSRLIKDFAKYYVSKKTTMYQEMAEIRQKPKLPPSKLKFSSDNFHFDDWRIRLKFFLILTDITKKNAPLQYIPGSHKINKNNMEKDLYINGKKGRYGFYKRHEVSKILKKNKLKIKVCEAKAGTLIVVNTNGIHQGTVLVDQKNPRIQLGIYSDVREKKWNPKNTDI